ncbi:hypothetical protein [Commensalibacter communis]|uniref:Uncharacterized protein n=1 Tax=Commensalibacter communis TaxID=2972786 RepID=A0A9W4XIZ1_9PROT|nr:hypothetical protein [Commensalibacter communis]CAI3933826.1 unnamed protein product [Commensalibacter communis]CAI3942155.1 unnamed protein product [Commensalibacter communis]CAI3944375.1 unnamed protein product [Commensalibacter communis]CAI3944489.1 unnamed protein product [Commensalibacter communis]CAI3960466.1 unnamed protein product [Commensalibacter communis]
MKKLSFNLCQFRQKNERNRQKMEIIHQNIKEDICEIVCGPFKPLKNGAKILASKLGISHHSVNNWFYKKCAPDSEKLIELMIENDEIASRILSLVEERKQKRQRENAVD